MMYTLPNKSNKIMNNLSIYRILFCANYHSILILMNDKYDLPIFINSMNNVRPINLTSNINNKIMTYLHNKSNGIINDLSSFNKYYIRLIRQIEHHVQLT